MVTKAVEVCYTFVYVWLELINCRLVGVVFTCLVCDVGCIINGILINVTFRVLRQCFLTFVSVVLKFSMGH